MGAETGTVRKNGLGKSKALEYHFIANFLPLMDEQKLQELADDIRQQGLVHPVLLFEGRILDGRNRYRACLLAGVEPRYEQFNGTEEDAVLRVRSLNRKRRDLTKDQMACFDALCNKTLNTYAAEREAAKERQMKTSLAGKDKSGNPIVAKSINTNTASVPVQIPEPKSRGVETREVRAKAAGVNANYINLADKLLEEEPEVFAQVQAGTRRLNQIRKERTKPRSPARSGMVGVREKQIISRTHEALRQWAQECTRQGRGLRDEELARLTKYSDNVNTGSSSLNKFFIRCALVPWATITITPKGRLCVIDRYLMAVCSHRAPSPKADVRAVIMALDELRRMIDRERKEAKAIRAASNWNPTIVHVAELVHLLDRIEAELDKISKM